MMTKTEAEALEIGTEVKALYKKELYDGKVLAIAGMSDSGKVRVHLFGDTAQYRELPFKAISLAEVEKEVEKEPEIVVAEVEVAEKKQPCSECEKLKEKISKFVGSVDVYVTREQVQSVFKGI